MNVAEQRLVIDVNEYFEMRNRLEQKKAYMKEYVNNYIKRRRQEDPDYRDTLRAKTHGLTLEEYRAKKEAGLIRQGRRKAVSV